MLLLPLRLAFALVVNLLLLPRLVVRLVADRLRAPRVVRLRLEGPLPERPPRRRPFARALPSVAGLRALGERLAKDARVTTILVELDGLDGAIGWARLESLRGVIAGWRAAGKRVVAHLSSPGNRELYLALACDELLVDESGPIGLIGVAVEVGFYGDALRRLGVDPELERIGEYKSYADTFMRGDMSPAHREATDAILDGLAARLVGAIASGRKVDAARAQAIVDGGPYTAEAAKAAGLVDGVCYRDEVAARIGLAKGKRPVDAAAWVRTRPRLYLPRLRRRRAIAVVGLEGSIVPGEGVQIGMRGLGADAACRALASARKSDRVVAAVLHVDSRGGSAAGSDRIWREVERLAAEKPVVAWFGDAAASGGYYLAAPAHRIVAQPSTLTGSIGVVGGKVSIERLLERFAVGTALLTRGAAAAMTSVRRRYDEAGRERLAAEIAATYRQFVSKVARGRRLDEEAVDRVARGRVWSGEAARERGLVDALGGLDVAIEECERLRREKVGREERLDVVDVRPKPRHEGGIARLLAGAVARLLVEDAERLVRAQAAERVLLVAGADRID